MADPPDKRSPPAPGAAKPAPHQVARTQEGKAARQDRLAAEMRNNLLKRKRQQRARSDRPQD
jgi:hypothetical protein